MHISKCQNLNLVIIFDASVFRYISQLPCLPTSSMLCKIHFIHGEKYVISIMCYYTDPVNSNVCKALRNV